METSQRPTSTPRTDRPVFWDRPMFVWMATFTAGLGIYHACVGNYGAAIGDAIVCGAALIGVIWANHRAHTRNS